MQMMIQAIASEFRDQDGSEPVLEKINQALRERLFYKISAAISSAFLEMEYDGYGDVPLPDSIALARSICDMISSDWEFIPVDSIYHLDDVCIF